MSTVAQWREPGGEHTGPGGARDGYPDGYGPEPYGTEAWTGHPRGRDPWTGPAEEPAPISGAMVQQHRAWPHDELRADYGAHLETHYPRLVAQLYAITLSPQDAHDAVQDAYSRAWRRWSELRSGDDGGPEDEAVGWVRRVAIRSSMRTRLFPRRRRAVAEETDPRTAALLDALAGLAAPDRRALVLHHMAGLSTDAVAELERVPEQTVRVRLARGRETVTERMADVLDRVVGPPGVPGPRHGRHDRAVEGGRG